MRRQEFEMSHREALAFLRSVPVIHLASTLADGAPVFRTVHGVVDGDWLGFHSAPKGEKSNLMGRVAVVCAEELVATVPSTFFDPVRACPATTYYRSVQVHGTIEEVAEPARKARILQKLMDRFQPEGGYQPIAGEDGSWDPMYRAAVRGLLVAGVQLDQIAGKAKLAQNRTPEQVSSLLSSLWQRGDAGDLRALELIRAANPAAPTPPFLIAPEGLRLHVDLAATSCHESAAAEVGVLLVSSGQDGVTAAQWGRAHLASAGWVGARDLRGALVASGRVVGDGVTVARLCDVVVAPRWRDCGAVEAIVQLLRQHPAARHARHVEPMA
jgi:nitroimidazol reductase NimA-like FMN-containing flavoprotein (pyridoxamine 5'-phosphate oxidase superfamily)